MVEQYYLLSSANGNAMNAQTPQPWQNENLFSTTTQRHHNNQQSFVSDANDDDGLQFASEIKPGPSRLAHTTDLSKSIFDIHTDEFDVYLNGNSDIDTHSIDNRAANLLSNRQTPHTITTGQFELDNHVALENPMSQALPHITVANFAKENVGNISRNGNRANASNDAFDIFGEASDWMTERNVVEYVFDNGIAEQLPNAIEPTLPPATILPYDSKWDDIFGVMKPVTNAPQPSASTRAPSHFQWPLPKADANNRNNSKPLAQKVPPTQPNFIAPLLPQTNKANATSIDPHNQPGPSGIVNQLQTQPNFIAALLPQTNEANATSIDPINPHNQPGPSGITNQLRQQMDKVGRAFDNGQMVTPYNGMFPVATPIANNLKRKHSGTIPIKVVRSTKQYETLLEMGFPEKDVVTALRKCNLDFYHTIECLSEPKRTAKRRKTFYQVYADSLSAHQQSPQKPIIEQSYEQPTKVDAKPIKKPANLYEELLQLEESGGIVKSIESFDCEICMETIEMKDGMILRNCLHRYCKDCLNGTIVHSDDVSIKCPYVSCEEIIQDREIRAVLSQDEYEKHLMKGVRVAQVTISGTILCNLPDCNGWCICEDVVNEFKCPQCKNINCIPCKAIHPERNCREYQDDLAAGDASGIISGQRRSEQAIQDLINRNEAMKCFSCGILIMKRDGCDYIECVMCKAGICWATRGPRYGPGGKGDFSGGCHCTAQKRCHKDCRGCH